MYIGNVSSLFRNLNSYNTSIPNSEKHVGSQQQCGQTQGSEVGKCFLLKVQSYPLFFPRGELGWHRGLPKNAVSYDEVQHDDDVLQSIEDEANEPNQVSLFVHVVSLLSFMPTQCLTISPNSFHAASGQHLCVSVRDYYCQRLQTRPALLFKSRQDPYLLISFAIRWNQKPGLKSNSPMAEARFPMQIERTTLTAYHVNMNCFLLMSIEQGLKTRLKTVFLSSLRCISKKELAGLSQFLFDSNLNPAGSSIVNSAVSLSSRGIFTKSPTLSKNHPTMLSIGS